MTRPRIMVVVGTRPEAVKLAPIVRRLRLESERLETRLVATAQHRALLDQALAEFGLASDLDLDLMRPGQSLVDLTARGLAALGTVFDEDAPDLVLAQGDTTTVLCAALAAYYKQVPFGHVEAGLRTGQRYRPFPEEGNRVLASHLATLHFAPTDSARFNLEKEGIPPEAIHVTGNSVIDALLWVASRPTPPPITTPTPRVMLVTCHRRESFGQPLERVCDALLDLITRRPDLSVVFPVHPNPMVGEVVGRRLSGAERIVLVEPLAYSDFVAQLKHSALILTDSGGVQEEAPSLGKPVLVLRAETERPEAVAAGTAVLVGTDPARIVEEVERALDLPDRPRLASPYNPYGDGWASERIVRAILGFLGMDAGPEPAGFRATWGALGPQRG